MRKRIVLLMAVVMLSCSSCGVKNDFTTEPQIAQMKSICELATMDCYYHTVAKYNKENASGVLLWKKDKQFWIEYSGVVRVGIDVSSVDIEVTDDKVTIMLPPAKVIDCAVDETSLTESSYIVGQKSASVKAEDQIEAFKQAQKDIWEVAEKDTAALANAQQRAQILLEDYVNNIGNLIGKEYTIEWIYLDDAGNEVGKEAESSAAE